MAMKAEAGRIRTTYPFIKINRKQHNRPRDVPRARRCEERPLHWLKQPLSKRALEDARLVKLIRASFVASHGIYGAPRVFLDFQAGETRSKPGSHA